MYFWNDGPKILSKEFYDQCCPSYQKVIDKLEQKIVELKQKIAAETKVKNDKNILDDGKTSECIHPIKATILHFAENYLTPEIYWDTCINYTSDDTEHEKKCYEIKALGYQHFQFLRGQYFLCSPWEDAKFYLKLPDYIYQNDFDDESYCGDERDINYPHNYLTKCFHNFERNALRLPSIKVYKRYEEMKLLYPKIKAAEDDVETWFKLLLEVEDDIFVKNNVEVRLGKNLFDVKLWMLYIEYLKQKGHFGELLKVYSNYCRFFLDDSDMLEKYKSETIKYGPVDLHWSNLFDFEREKNCEMQNGKDEIKSKEDDGNVQSAEEELMDTEDENTHNVEDVNSQNSDGLPLNKQLFTTFYDTYQFQKFPFKEPLMNYILKNANHRLLRNLFKTCKYFFYKKSTPICYRFDIGLQAKFDGESLTLSYSCNTDLYVKKTFITGSIELSDTLKNSETYMSKLIPRLSCCEAKYINLFKQNLTFNEFKFLVSHGQVVQYVMNGGHIKDKNNKYVDLEKIMVYFCNIEKLELPKVKCNAKTAHALLNQCFKGKIFLLHIVNICGDPF